MAGYGGIWWADGGLWWADGGLWWADGGRTKKPRLWPGFVWWCVLCQNYDSVDYFSASASSMTSTNSAENLSGCALASLIAAASCALVAFSIIAAACPLVAFIVSPFMVCLIARRCDSRVRSIVYFDREVKRIRAKNKKTPEDFFRGLGNHAFCFLLQLICIPTRLGSRFRLRQACHATRLRRSSCQTYP